jgi:hypothetical protein
LSQIADKLSLMSKAEFIKQLRSTAEELRPLTQSASPRAAIWDGTSYLQGEAKVPDPYALAWWSILGTIADLIEAQESPLSRKQTAYLSRVLFGGMGSLNDLAFKAAGAINGRLDDKRRSLFASFKKLKQPAPRRISLSKLSGKSMASE